MKRNLFLLVFVMVGQLLLAQNETCSDVMSTSLSSITFLEEQKAARQSPCISEVIKQLAKSRDVGAVHVLVGYLDFVDPATRPRPDGFSDVRPVYPAVAALFRIGKPATSDLLEAIQQGKTPIVRQNAVKTYQSIYRDDLASGIRLLRNEKLATGSAEGEHRLQKTLEVLAEDCRGRTEEEAQACKAAAQGD
jgi:hypothetical protein